MGWETSDARRSQALQADALGPVLRAGTCRDHSPAPDRSARGSRVTVYYAKGRKGGKFRKLGRTSRVNSKGRFTLRFKLRRYGVYRLQYRFKGSSLVLGGKVTEAIRIRRTIRFG